VKEKKKKPSLGVVLAVGGPKDKEPEPDMAEGEDGGEEANPGHEAMMEFHEAMTAKSWPRALEAFKTLQDYCASEEEGEGDEEEEG